jgi:HK97 family phage portal protein
MIHNSAAAWNRALLDNAARPSGALVFAADDSGGLTTEQFERLKAELEQSYAGGANAGRPMVLEGGLSWQSMALSPAEMDFAELKASAARDIALAFGVPPMLLGRRVRQYFTAMNGKGPKRLRQRAAAAS